MRSLALFVCLFLVLPLTGCWDLREIQNINYITTWGLDYENGQYTVYAQMIDLGNVAKQEGASNQQKPNEWVGKGQGPTVNLAMIDLYRTTQLRTLWSHVSSVLLSERVLQHDISLFLDALGRYREIRFTPWIFGTKAPVKSVMETSAFFNLSVLSKITHEPTPVYEQSSWIEPIRIQRFLADFDEPGRTVILPSIGIEPKQWLKNKTPDLKLQVDGAFLIKNKQTKGWLNIEQLRGLRWLNPRTVRTPILLRNDDRNVGVISLEHPRVDIRQQWKGGRPRYSVRVLLTGNIVELLENVNEEEIRALSERQVIAEIEETFRHAVSLGADPYQLEYHTYRNDYKRWKTLDSGRRIPLTDDSISDIRPAVHINHSGILKLDFGK